jgi:hypothetical protein
MLESKSTVFFFFVIFRTKHFRGLKIICHVLVQLTILSRSCCRRLQSSLVDIAKHSRLCINGNILSWLEACLTEREQQVTIEGEKSSTARVTSGVPQGPVLSL